MCCCAALRSAISVRSSARPSRFKSSLPQRLYELAILVTARQWTAQYEWQAHHRSALQAGPQRFDLRCHRGRAAADGHEKDEEAVYNFVSELLNTKQVSDATFNAAKSAFGERGVVDIIAVTGWYNIVSMMLNVDRYPVLDGTQPELKPLKRDQVITARPRKLVTVRTRFAARSRAAPSTAQGDPATGPGPARHTSRASRDRADALDRDDVGGDAHVDLVLDGCLQHRIERLAHLLLEPLVDVLLFPEISIAILHPLEVRRRHAAGVGEDVGDDEDAFVVQELVRVRCCRPVGAFRDDLGLDERRVVHGDLILERGGNQHVNVKTPESVVRQRFAAREAGHRLVVRGRVLEQFRDVEPFAL
jgi:alkylhydroperoxidase family enzyme